MTTKAKLSEIVDFLDVPGDGIDAYFNKKTGKTIIVTEEDRSEYEDSDILDKEGSAEGILDETDNIADDARDFFLHEDDYLELPSRFDIDEYGIMADFIASLENRGQVNQLHRAIQGSGAFRRFKDLIRELGVDEQWLAFRRAAFKEIAIEWCEENGIAYLDDFEVVDNARIQEERKPALYVELEKQLRSLLKGETDLIANTANTAALLYHSLPDLNWAGFYFLKGDVLVLGPFQGQPACVRIPLGRGVCGTAANERRTLVVPNVHEFPGHIACDSASNSEIVIPLQKDEKVLGVLDLDSPNLGRFDDTDREGLERLVRLLYL
jgi:GAF domain-containing protein